MATRIGTKLIALGSLLMAIHSASSNEGLYASASHGAEVFANRCSLCHGSDAMGGGLLSLTIADYPATNLLTPKYATDLDSLREAIFWGGSDGRMSHLSPPWGNELTCVELESVVLFVQEIRKNVKSGLTLLGAVASEQQPSMKLGRLVYDSRCQLCHGASGHGDGKLAKVIKDPPPFDLTQSTVPTAYLQRIIGEGGAAVGRSVKMPPWKDELSEAEFSSVIAYIKALRE